MLILHIKINFLIISIQSTTNIYTCLKFHETLLEGFACPRGRFCLMMVVPLPPSYKFHVILDDRIVRLGSKGSTTMQMAVGPWSGLHRKGTRVFDDELSYKEKSGNCGGHRSIKSIWRVHIHSYRWCVRRFCCHIQFSPLTSFL